MAQRESRPLERSDLQLIKSNAPSAKSDRLSMKSKLTIAGLLIGSLVGFLVRPTVPFVGQLPFGTVITRGANLQGLDQLLIGYARTSFNYLIAGTIVGAVVGLIAAFVIPNQKR
jgi:F0F1-type ATP synthase assembly protein I